MSLDLLISLLSLGCAIIGGIGAVIQRDRAMNRSITAGDQQVEKEIRIELQDTERDLRAQVNTLNERLTGINERFVRRDDLTQHIDRIERLIEQGQAEQRETNKRIDLLLVAMGNKPFAA